VGEKRTTAALLGGMTVALLLGGMTVALLIERARWDTVGGRGLHC
jgi:hypothetical protein